MPPSCAASERMKPSLLARFFVIALKSTQRCLGLRLRELRWCAAPLLVLAGCDRVEPPGSTTARRVATAPSSSAMPVASSGVGAADVAPGISASPSAGPVGSAEPEPPVPHPGPFLTVLQPSVAIYSEPNAERSNKLGYAQSGAKLAVTGKPKPGDKCSSGWMQVVPAGFVCTNAGTLDEKDPRSRFTLKRPALDNVLPYTYARNVKNGTPLYRSIPTRAQMLEYEPYLKKEVNSVAQGTAGASSGPAAPNAPAVASGAVVPSQPAPPSADPSNKTAAPEDDRPWWQQEGIEDRLHEIRLSDLQKDSDDVLALRMVKGFYIAVDRTFGWHGRLWYKSTKGLVAPADRMGQAAPSDFKGVELGPEWHLPVGWVYGGREKTTTYELDLEKNRARAVGNVARFVALQLTDRSVEVGGTTYRELAAGKWVRKDHLRIPEPGEPPKDLGDRERWVDVDLSSQTLVLFEGTTPIYATLVSTGKSSKVKEKDHATPTGQWRIREKHLTNTMDGDGTAAGDLPYSIEDVPYVMYFHKSYAVHGAFWHRNYGVQMSHGCVNLAPLDAKAVFFRTEPSTPDGWHGAWSSQGRLGSWVVVHE
jgi:hypothetical protein